MASLLSSQAAVLATAMAISGTVFVLAFRLQKFLPPSQFSIDQIPQSSQQIPRSCISSEGKKKRKKKVHFSVDVVDPKSDGEDFRRKLKSGSGSGRIGGDLPPLKKRGENRGMPANRAALYNGILRDRVVHRLAYSC